MNTLPKSPGRTSHSTPAQSHAPECRTLKTCAGRAPRIPAPDLPPNLRLQPAYPRAAAPAMSLNFAATGSATFRAANGVSEKSTEFRTHCCSADRWRSWQVHDEPAEQGVVLFEARRPDQPRRGGPIHFVISHLRVNGRWRILNSRRPGTGVEADGLPASRFSVDSRRASGFRRVGLLARGVERCAVDHEALPGRVRDSDVLPGRHVLDLGDESSVAHLLPAGVDVLEPGVVGFVVFHDEVQYKGKVAIEAEALLVERSLGRERDRILEDGRFAEAEREPVVCPDHRSKAARHWDTIGGCGATAGEQGEEQDSTHGPILAYRH